MIGRRTVLGGIIMGGIPVARPDQHYEPPESAIPPGQRSGTFRGRLVIIFGTGPNVGLFVYSPAPGFGNLVESIAAANGTDPYGNAYLSGFTSYQRIGGGSVLAVQTDASSQPGPVWKSAATAAGPYATVASMVADVNGNITITSPAGTVTVTPAAVMDNGLTITGQAGPILSVDAVNSGPAVGNVQLAGVLATDAMLDALVGGDGHPRWRVRADGRHLWGTGAAVPDTLLYRSGVGQLAADFIAADNGGAAEVWNTVAFQNSWVNAGTGPNLQFRLVAAPFKSMQWVGRVTAPAGIAANQTITAATATPTYRPANVQSIVAVNVSTGGLVRLSYGTNGQLTYQTGAVAGNAVEIPAGNGLISLDA
jgi:hypothetical protein